MELNPRAFSALWNGLIAVLVALYTAINRPFLAKSVAGLRFELPLATRFSTLKQTAGALPQCLATKFQCVEYAFDA